MSVLEPEAWGMLAFLAYVGVWVLLIGLCRAAGRRS